MYVYSVNVTDTDVPVVFSCASESGGVQSTLLEVEKEEEVIDIESRTRIDNGKVIRVEYEGGVVFYLNYNNFAITVEEFEIPAMGFQAVIA